MNCLKLSYIFMICFMACLVSDFSCQTFSARAHRPRNTTSRSNRSRTTTTLPPTVTTNPIISTDQAQSYGRLWQNSNDPSHTFSRKSQENILNWIETKNGKTMDRYKLIATDDSKNEVLIYNGNRNYPAYIRLTRDSALFSTNKANGFNPIHTGYWVF